MLGIDNPLIVQNYSVRHWHLGRMCPGCRGFIGPVPPPLWIRRCGYAFGKLAHSSTGRAEGANVEKRGSDGQDLLGLFGQGRALGQESFHRGHISGFGIDPQHRFGARRSDE